MLYERLEGSSYEHVVFAGCRQATTLFGARSLPQAASVSVIALLGSTDKPIPAIYDEVLARARTCIAASGAEAAALSTRLRMLGRAEPVVIPPQVRIHPLAVETASSSRTRRTLLLAAWIEGADDDAVAVSLAIGGSFAGAVPIFSRRARPRYRSLAFPGALLIDARSATDIPRWIPRAFAFVDVRPHAALATRALEAMAAARPVIVPWNGGASREYVEEGDAGVWFAGGFEFVAAVDVLRDSAIRQALGRQGQEYVVSHGNPEAWVRRVCDYVLVRTSLEGSTSSRVESLTPASVTTGP